MFRILGDNKLSLSFVILHFNKSIRRLCLQFFFIVGFCKKKRAKNGNCLWLKSEKWWELIFTFLYKWEYWCCMLRVERWGVLVNIFITEYRKQGSIIGRVQAWFADKKIGKMCYWLEMDYYRTKDIWLLLFFVLCISASFETYVP